MMSPEFSRPLSFAAVRGEGHIVELQAKPSEREALARRLGVLDLPAFAVRWRLSCELTGSIAAEVTIEADVVQACVMTLEPVPQQVAETVRIRFLPFGRPPTDDDPEAPDEISCERNVMDLGEAATETLALLLDPYPRAEGAEMPPEATDDGQGLMAGLLRRASKPR